MDWCNSQQPMAMLFNPPIIYPYMTLRCCYFFQDSNIRMIHIIVPVCSTRRAKNGRLVLLICTGWLFGTPPWVPEDSTADSSSAKRHKSWYLEHLWHFMVWYNTMVDAVGAGMRDCNRGVRRRRRVAVFCAAAPRWWLLLTWSPRHVCMYLYSRTIMHLSQSPEFSIDCTDCAWIDW
jgi:hypothetical protein